jgi:hypothetical protein
MNYPVQYRHAIVTLLITGLMLFGLNEATAEKCIYGGRAISAEAAGFDALAFEIFGNPSADGSNSGTEALDEPSTPNQDGAK